MLFLESLAQLGYIKKKLVEVFNSSYDLETDPMSDPTKYNYLIVLSTSFPNLYHTPCSPLPWTPTTFSPAISATSASRILYRVDTVAVTVAGVTAVDD